ncbi:MAG: DUF4011 domain-containing protein, partial [Planctomycetaceae bacterium]|nr:DUF4011 domain-containing protein [Planctomycetaceae bacterium]
FAINRRLHPVIARSIRIMTELDRHQRPQNPASLLQTLENYRDQAVDFETDLAADQQETPCDRPGRRQGTLNKLQERLFDISRRNRLLNFQATMQSVNLTHASIPVMLQPEQIRLDQIVTWGGRFQKSVLKGKAVALNRFLNFREAIYLPGVLDRIRSEARRDETEYGFAQLRLVVCFLRWADLKTEPPEQYESPLILLPVRLDIIRGIHDRYTITADQTTGEVNPVVRHLFQSLYHIQLPEEVELSEEGIAQFYTQLQQLVTAQDASVHLTRIDRPRIDILHEKARRRLDHFRRRAGLSGRSIRRFRDVDYSYESVNYHPLGIQLFQQWIAPHRTVLRELVRPSEQRSEQPKPTSDGTRNDSGSPEATPEPEESGHSLTTAETAEEIEVEKQFYTVRSRRDDNPYNWEFDLCNVTLVNLKYRRMTLVRDYAVLVTDNTENRAFESTFSIAPADRSGDTVAVLPSSERFHVVSCDPTQSKAIALARTGLSYIIQGPPGTGKSQTITNLIADFLAQGKRILFVCEKRAAIDVVFHRLRQQQLHELCCLIHDSQADKKQFVMDLKETYETFLGESELPPDRHASGRNRLIGTFEKYLARLTEYNQVMVSEPESCGIRLRGLLDRLIALRCHVPVLSPEQQATLPHYRTWHEHTDVITQLSQRVAALTADGIFANHPLSCLNPSVTAETTPAQLVNNTVAAALAVIGQIQAKLHQARLQPAGSAPIADLSLSDLTALCETASDANRIAGCGLMALVHKDSEETTKWVTHLRRLEHCEKELANAQTSTVHWIRKLSPQDTRNALTEAKR